MKFTLSIFCVLVLSISLQAASIVGGSTLLSMSDANQLETWLGEGPITLTNIFSTVTGDGKTNTSFHSALDGQGRTFVVYNVTFSRVGGSMNQIIGGYNPLSWNSNSGYNVNPTDAGRSAFIFNLTNSELQRQKLGDGTSYGYYQTYNHANYGPTFGGGHDIYVNINSRTGYSYHYSYGIGTAGSNILGETHTYGDQYTFSSIEVFTIEQGVVPEPASLLLLTITLGFFLLKKM